MKKAIFIFLILTAAVSLGFIAWMNLTPGYFDRFDYLPCDVRYETYSEHMDRIESLHPLIPCPLESEPRAWLERTILNILYKIDFNKGERTHISKKPPIPPQEVVPPPISPSEETGVASISSIPVTTGPLKGWSYKSNGECGVKFPIPPKEDPYRKKIGGSDAWLFWDFINGSHTAELLKNLGGGYKQGLAIWVPHSIDGWIIGSDAPAPGVVVSCSLNSNRINNRQMLTLLNEKLREYNQDTTINRGLSADSYTIKTSTETSRWGHQVVDLTVSEQYPQPTGYPTVINTVSYTLFTTPQYIYEVKLFGKTTDAFVKQTAKKIFENLIFE